MSSAPLSPIRKAWYKWKSLHLPWRKRFLVGLDLQGNTFWEFRDTLNSHQHRMRRIVRYPSTTPYSDIQISPQWHQWLRHTRADPPSLAEQSHDLLRQEQLKVLAQQADARWRAKPSLLNRPAETEPALRSSTVEPPTSHAVTGETGASEVIGKVRNKVRGGSQEDQARIAKDAVGEGNPVMQVPNHDGYDGTRIKENKGKENPWEQARGAPSETWQPQTWSPSGAARR